MKNIHKKLQDFSRSISGDVYDDHVTRLLYATDASAYQEMPLAVIVPRTNEDIRKILEFARRERLPLIPRTAGTSLAGQVVGNGIVVDTSKYLNRIIEINPDERWVKVEPGVVLDELNMHLKEYDLYFGPETSTSNRCMMGGMVGNNSCGAHSLIYGSTRDHTIEVEGFLSDGSEVTFSAITEEELKIKLEKKDLEGDIYRNIHSILSDEKNQENIRAEFPDPRMERRNTGYALDILLNSSLYEQGSDKPLNLANLICGSEGTLMFITAVKLNLVPLPPKEKGLLVVHHKSIAEALKANLVALKYRPGAIELIDHYILECTKTSIEHRRNRFFLKGEPGALLCVEFARDTKEEIEKVTTDLIQDLKNQGFGYEYPLLFGPDIPKVWALRKAGLGLLSNVPGDAKPQPVIEDTAVHPEYLPDYIDEFDKVLERMGLNCVYYAHIATGELHLRPMINLKTEEGVRQFREVATEIARLVKKYKGSLSGEHGDGRLRGEFIPMMIGEENYRLVKSVKATWDPENLLNPGKITDTPPMDTSLRYSPGQDTPEFDTAFDFSDTMGMLRMAEKCNGSADCRKSSIIGGTMCPSYQATFDEDKTTRARANMLRDILTRNQGKNPFNNKELYKILDLCLSCKGCKSECPSGVDMAKLKAEFLYQFYKANSPSLRTRLIARFSMTQALASKFGFLYNAIISAPLFARPMKLLIGFAPGRSLPKVHFTTFRKWLKKNLPGLNSALPENAPAVFLFVDEFTNYNDVPIGITTARLLNRLGYRIQVLDHAESGRPYLSKGFLDKAGKLAETNVRLFGEHVSEAMPLVGIEPSAIFSFRDEYPDLLRGDLQEKARHLAENVFTIEEFLVREMENKRLENSIFTIKPAHVYFHGHCQQKAIATTLATKKALALPQNYVVEEIKSGCCGMAGSFGYEKEHFDLSMKIGEMVLFPAIQKAAEDAWIVASGTSCRHQIKDGTRRKAVHPVEVLYQALA